VTTTWPTFVGLLERDWRVMRREFVTVLARSAMQPLFFVIVFGYMLPAIGTIDGDTYAPILLPGILAMSTVLSGMQAVTLPIAIDLGFVREIDDRLLCPVRIEWIGVEKILFGAFQAAIAAIVVVPLALWIMQGEVSLSWSQVPALVVVIVAASLLAASFGLFLGTLVQPRQLALVFSVIVTPLIFFGCAQYSWTQLGASGLRIGGPDGFAWLQYLVLVNPLVYASEALRAVVTPDLPHMPWWGIVTGGVTALVVFGVAGIRRFKRRALS
jgi:ABC-2 type transport system permease protein